MKNFKLRITALLLTLILLLSSLVPAFASEARAALVYSKEYNSGTRNVVCTTLDGTSAASYYQDHDYDDLSEMSASALFSSLQTLMRRTHTYTSSYDDCHHKANQTDCTNGSGNNVSLIYTSYSATMSQWNGWNREHVWPQSLGGGNTTGGGADMHHIRPSDAGVNSSRGNKKYGEAGSDATEKYGSNPAVGVLGGTYNSTYFEPLDNVKGDVARICLYVYVRWNSSWGADSITDVFQSVDVLLQWCEEDPVDTWEMGRNEVIEDLQGNRNVFIDYPEYAWLLFGREVPEDMVTPSGEAGGTSTGGGSSQPDTPDTPTDPTPETPVADSAKLSFASKDQRTSFSTSQQIWEQNGITLTNDKAASTNNVADYANPVRLYKSSSITIEAPKNIIKIEFSCKSGYVLSLSNATVDGTTVTVTLSTPAKSYTISSLSAQVRLDSLTVYYEGEPTPEPDPEPECKHTNTAESKTAATCDKAGSLTVTCEECGAIVSSVSIPALGHDYVDDVCVRCGDVIESVPSEPTSGSWQLVTDASKLKAGDKIVIVSGTFVAGDISSQIMASVSGVSESDGYIATLPSGAVVLTLGGSAGAWTLSNPNGQKLGATAVKKLAWNKGTTNWSISISSGNATIQNATSSYGRFLYNVDSPRFTTYISYEKANMLLPQIYKYVEAPAVSEDVNIKLVSMTVGSSLALNYFVSGYDNNAEYYMVFTMHGVASERIYGTEKNGYLVFSYENIAPQFMGDNVSAVLYNEDGTKCDSLDSFSVKEYAEKLIAAYGNNKELMYLVADMLRYGAAAQEYRGYKEDELVTDGFDLNAYRSDATPSDEDNDSCLVSEADNGNSFTSAGVRFDFDNKIFVKFKTTDISSIKIMINGVDASDKAVYVDGVYVLYTDGILATEFDKVFTIEMYVGGEINQMLTYSVNSYAYAKYANSEDKTTPIAQLVIALYRYGISATAYVG